MITKTSKANVQHVHKCRNKPAVVSTTSAFFVIFFFFGDAQMRHVKTAIVFILFQVKGKLRTHKYMLYQITLTQFMRLRILPYMVIANAR